MKISRLLRAVVIPLLAVTMAAEGAPRGRGPTGPLKAELYTVRSAPFDQTVSTVGTLRANESVTLVSELARRLVKIHVKEGSEVAMGDLLFQLDDSDLTAELAELDARRQLATTNKTRVDELLPRNAISRQEYDSSTAELAVLEAQRKTQEVMISKTQIRAPFAGKVGVRHVSEGAYVTPTTELVTLQDVSRIKVDFPLPEKFAQSVREGQKFTFTVAGNGETFHGVVTVVEPAINPATRSLQVRGLCDNPNGLHPGGFAEVTLALDGASTGLMVPSQAIVPSQRGHGVYVIADGKAELVPVDIGVRTADQVQILRGIKEGDRVATTNLLRMRPGVDVVEVTE